jgi:hypothetical protein
VYIPDNSGNVTLAQKDLHNKLRPWLKTLLLI